jgi:hypothetical protein
MNKLPTNAPDPGEAVLPGDFDAELEAISHADLEFVEAGSEGRLSIELLRSA